MCTFSTHVAVGLLLGAFLDSWWCTLACIILSTCPDIDYLIHGLHRALLHNIFVISALSTIGIIIGRDRKEKAIYAICPITHIFLDLVTGPVELLYPISKRPFQLFNILNIIYIKNLSPLWCDKLGIAIFFTWIIVIIVKYLKKVKLFEKGR